MTTTTSGATERLTPGALVRARGRDWVLLPSPEPEVALLRPLTGGEDEAVGVFLPLERRDIRPSEFPLPDPRHTGDATGSLLLYDAARLSLRSGAAPFRSLGRISVTPRPYQFVPLIMALRLDPVRLLIADDVGVGKTIEAAMIARELLDRGLARRLAVLCPAHLCDQWERELREKFALAPTVVQPARIARLERQLPRADLSLYQYYRHLVLSIDFVKADRHRGHFLRNAPDLVIVDEAHMAARPGAAARRADHQRYELVRDLAADPRRHVILVTATPHSGIEASFRSLLGLLDPQFDAPSGGAIGGETGAEFDRRRLLPHVVQRRRLDIRQWLGTETPFPERASEEQTYTLAAPYRSLFEDVLTYCRETVQSAPGVRAQVQRVRHWAAIALLRCVLSSPDAAVAVLSARAERQRAPTDEPRAPATLAEGGDTTDAEVDATFRPQVLDAADADTAGDYAPTAPLEEAAAVMGEAEQRRLTGFLRRARDLAHPDRDLKLKTAAEIAAGLLREGYRPIVFCRFIATAKYLEAWLPRLLGAEYPGLRAVAVTGEVGDEERRERVDELVREPVRVLVATDCLSEGINLQEHFDAVLHYDLPWNPNRLEQREGRVDRFGQTRRTVRASLLYGADNPVDLVVLDVLIRKARTIRKQLGVSVPVPADSDQVVQAVVDSVLLRRPGRSPAVQLELGLTDPDVSRLHRAWDAAAEQEERQRAFFAQGGIKPEEVARELEATDPVLGDAATVRRFLANAAQRFGGALLPGTEPGVYQLSPGELRPALAARGLDGFPLPVAFDVLHASGTQPAARNGRRDSTTPVTLGRTHPLVAAYCDAVLGAALATQPDDRFARSGAMLTDAVRLRTGVLLLRLRYLLRDAADELAEEIVLAAFERRAGAASWLEPLGEAAADLLAGARPVANLPPEERMEHVAWALDLLGRDPEWFRPLVEQRVDQLRDAHNRLRALVNASRLRVEPRTPPDILGCYVLVPAAPAPGGGGAG
jgi:superfamily II DNA or RNA helicase